MKLSMLKKQLFVVTFIACGAAALVAETPIELGQRYARQKNYTEAVKWYRKAAEQGNKEAQSFVGQCYVLGLGVKKDYKQAIYWFRKAAEQGDKDVQYILGHCYYTGDGVKKDYKQAVYWFRKAAEQGVARAQSVLGDCYAKGYGMKKDSKQAVYWWGKAAKQGDKNAQTNLNSFHFDEKSVVNIIENGDKQYVTKESGISDKYDALCRFHRCNCPDVRNKFPVFFKEFEPRFRFNRPNPSSEKELVSKYSSVIQFIQEEYKKPIIAHKHKIMSIDEYPVTGSQWDTFFDFNVSSKCIWHALMLAQKGLPEAQYFMGRIILNSRRSSVTQSDLNTAFKWLFLAADSGYTDAYYMVGRICSLDKNYEDAIIYWKKGIEKGNISCMYALANFCFFTLRDYQLALDHYKMAADRNHNVSVEACAYIYSGKMRGYDTSKLANRELARKYFQKLVSIEKKYNSNKDRIAHFEKRVKYPLWSEYSEYLWKPEKSKK